MTDETSASQSRLTDYLHLVGITILYYDHILTFGDEYRRYWRTRKNLRYFSTWLFLLNRYFTFFASIGVFIGNFSSSITEESCAHWTLYRQLILIFAWIAINVNLLLRLYAVFNKDKRVLAFLLCVAVVLLCVDGWFYSFIGRGTDVSLVGGCHGSLSRSVAIRTAAPWESLLSFDVLIFFLIMYKAFKERGRLDIITEDNLFGLIVRDGAMYFAVVAAAELANILTFYVSAPVLRGMLSTLTTNISVTMLSRLMFNLRERASSSKHHFNPTTRASTVHFQRPDETLFVSTAQGESQSSQPDEFVKMSGSGTTTDIELEQRSGIRGEQNC